MVGALFFVMFQSTNFTGYYSFGKMVVQHKSNGGIVRDEMKLEYKKCGDYLLPDIKLLHEEHISLGKYGRLRRGFLQKTTHFYTAI